MPRKKSKEVAEATALHGVEPFTHEVVPDAMPAYDFHDPDKGGSVLVAPNVPFNLPDLRGKSVDDLWKMAKAEEHQFGVGMNWNVLRVYGIGRIYFGIKLKLQEEARVYRQNFNWSQSVAKKWPDAALTTINNYIDKFVLIRDEIARIHDPLSLLGERPALPEFVEKDEATAAEIVAADKALKEDRREKAAAARDRKKAKDAAEIERKLRMKILAELGQQGRDTGGDKVAGAMKMLQEGIPQEEALAGMTDEERDRFHEARDMADLRPDVRELIAALHDADDETIKSTFAGLTAAGQKWKVDQVKEGLENLKRIVGEYPAEVSDILLRIVEAVKGRKAMKGVKVHVLPPGKLIFKPKDGSEQEIILPAVMVWEKAIRDKYAPKPKTEKQGKKAKKPVVRSKADAEDIGEGLPKNGEPAANGDEDVRESAKHERGSRRGRRR